MIPLDYMLGIFFQTKRKEGAERGAVWSGKLNFSTQPNQVVSASPNQGFNDDPKDQGEIQASKTPSYSLSISPSVFLVPPCIALHISFTIVLKK